MSSFYQLLIITLLFTSQIGCGEVNTNSNASGEVPFPDSTPNDNDSVFEADRFSLGTTGFNGSLSSDDLVDFYYVSLPLRVYRSYQIQLTNLTGEIDIEMYNAYLNLESWSDNPGVEDELIQYWRDFTELDNNVIFIKIINRSGNTASYTLGVE